MSEARRIGVVGGGIFGAQVALAAAARGHAVTVFEAKQALLQGASRNNQNRLHLGFHYPRDLETGRQSILGFQRFIDAYPECISGGFPNAYFIADEGSFTTPDAFLAFCTALGERFTPMRAQDFEVAVQGASTGVLCDEVVYDCTILAELVARRLHEARIDLRLGQPVAQLEEHDGGIDVITVDGGRESFDSVVNCCYADINRLTAQLGYPVAEREYEYTVVPIIELDIPRVGITIMDGPFMTLLPHGRSTRFLLYAVENTVVAREIREQMDPAWWNPYTSPFARMDPEAFFAAMVASCSRYVPALANARCVGFLQGPRMVLARNHATDSRPSIINSHGARYHTVFSGKIDHAVWVAEEVAGRL